MNIFPLDLLAQLEAAGIRLSVRAGKLHGPIKRMTAEQQQLVSENKEALLAVITYQCPTCNQPLRLKECDTFKYLECVLDPTHYAELYNKVWGEPCFISTDGVKPERCADCGSYNNGPYKYCDKCWLKIIEDDEKEATLF